MLGGRIEVDAKLQGRPVIRVDFISTRLADAGLEHLKGLAQLQHLNLQGTHVTDAGLEHLKGLTRLQVLFLGDTRVTDAGVESLRKALPALTIHR
jgi:hypothetical protein